MIPSVVQQVEDIEILPFILAANIQVESPWRGYSARW